MPAPLKTDREGKKILPLGLEEESQSRYFAPVVAVRRIEKEESVDIPSILTYDTATAHYWKIKAGSLDCATVKVGLIDEVMGLYRVWAYQTKSVLSLNQKTYSVVGFLRILLDYSSNRRGRRFEALVRCDKKSTKNTLQKIGFQEEGLLRMLEVSNGQVYDVFILSIFAGQVQDGLAQFLGRAAKTMEKWSCR